MPEPHASVREYQKAYVAYFNKPAPDVRVTCDGDFFVRDPVGRQYGKTDFAKITRFFQKGGK